jgi:hypothetical protein
VQLQSYALQRLTLTIALCPILTSVFHTILTKNDDYFPTQDSKISPSEAPIVFSEARTECVQNTMILVFKRLVALHLLTNH